MCDELALSTRPRTPDREKKNNNVMRQRTQAHDSRFSPPQVRRSLMQIVRCMKDRGSQHNDNNERPRIGDSLCYSDGVIKENCAVVNGVRSRRDPSVSALVGYNGEASKPPLHETSTAVGRRTVARVVRRVRRLDPGESCRCGKVVASFVARPHSIHRGPNSIIRRPGPVYRRSNRHLHRRRIVMRGVGSVAAVLCPRIMRRN